MSREGAMQNGVRKACVCVGFTPPGYSALKRPEGRAPWADMAGVGGGCYSRAWGGGK